MSAQRLPNRNTLITGYFGVLEVDRTGKTVWKYSKGSDYTDAERLVNGNTLVVDERGRRVIEVDRKGEIVWQRHGGFRLMDADRLPNGNTLIVEGANSRVVEVTPKGEIVFELKGLKRPNDADRLANGNTLVAQWQEVAEYDAKGKKIWSAKVKTAGEINRY